MSDASPLIVPELVALDVDLGADKHEAIAALADLLAATGRVTDRDQLVRDIEARETQASTGLPGGLAIPHARTTGVDRPTLAFARAATPVDFGSRDGAADLIFVIAAPPGGTVSTLSILSALAKGLTSPAFIHQLRTVEGVDEACELLSRKVAL